ncbi:MAG: radical SAM domain protein [Candidatus Scalindua rubra]|uniref:Radical SAM domain protein n=1 Tax=Candidatus Scalindua rubra TaxID=1872076 RepID=A0A1E3X699_9BACT|nr:MAG: radical SAM domain protein [Candidatus Scalindua rubra]
MNSNKPFVQWRFLVNRYNEHEIEKAKALAKEIGVDKLEITIFRCDMGNELVFNNKKQFENVQKWLPGNETLSMYDYSNKMKKKIKVNDCGWLWSQATINWNGSVSPCCAVWYEKFDFGNINRDTFRKIWNNEKYQGARKIVRGDRINAPGNICHICCLNKAAI